MDSMPKYQLGEKVSTIGKRTTSLEVDGCRMVNVPVYVPNALASVSGVKQEGEAYQYQVGNSWVGEAQCYTDEELARVQCTLLNASFWNDVYLLGKALIEKATAEG